MADAASIQPDNPTRAFLAAAVAERRIGVSLGANPALASFQAVLLDVSDEELAIGFTAPDYTTQGNGVVGGGALATMLDQAMAIAVLARLKPGQTCSTIGLNVNILRSGLAGAFVAKAAIDKLGGRVVFARAQLLDEAGALLATASSSLAVLAERAQPGVGK